MKKSIAILIIIALTLAACAPATLQVTVMAPSAMTVTSLPAETAERLEITVNDARLRHRQVEVTAYMPA